jgi:hypothetical protein
MTSSAGLVEAYEPFANLEWRNSLVPDRTAFFWSARRKIAREL